MLGDDDHRFRPLERRAEVLIEASGERVDLGRGDRTAGIVVDLRLEARPNRKIEKSISVPPASAIARRMLRRAVATNSGAALKPASCARPDMKDS